ncbi:unannotated protein [freshwater metagenome]|uniref:Unannotated protein n=1 Tax=freshwater metagenome TaxID=449393 RepID=A0A6J6TMM7_9ZZZZ
MARFPRSLAVLVPLAALVAGCGPVSRSAPVATESSSTSSTAPVVPSTVSPSTVASTVASTVRAPASTAEPTTTAPAAAPTANPEVLRTAEERVLARFREHAASLLRNGYQAVGIAIEREGKVLGTVTAGKDPRGRPLANTARFRLASVSKVLLATLVMQLVEEGKLRLDTPVADQWGGRFPVGDRRARSVTVRQLLQHTSGLDRMWNTFFKDPATDWRNSAGLALASRLYAEPGTRYRYSNANFVVLGALVERVTGGRLATLINNRVLAPLGIAPSSMIRTKVTDSTGPSYVVTPGRTYLEALGPAGSWTLSPSEVALVLEALNPNAPSSLLSRSSRLAMQPPCVGNPRPAGQTDKERYGLGLLSNGDLWGHTGTIEGARAAAFVLPNGYVIVLLAATEAVPLGERLLHVFESEISDLRALPGGTEDVPVCLAA